jgi:TolB-like protein
MKRLALLLLLAAVSLPCLAQASHPTVYIEAQNGFETYIAAAIRKKQVPIDVVTDPARATFKHKAAPVEIKQESSAGKIARCLFAYCAGIEDKGNVSVQLIDMSSSKMLWAYSVNKQRGGSKNQQSMAEAVAKHFKEFLLGAQPAVQAAIEAAALAPSPSPVPTAPILASTPAPATPVSFQRQDSAHIAPAMQTAPLPVRGDESLGDAARHEKHQKACLELAKENPSVACK